MSLIPIEKNPSLKRVENSGAIVNTSKSDFDNYMLRKNSELEKTTQFNQLRTDVDELKDMMKLLISKLDTNS